MAKPPTASITPPELKPTTLEDFQQQFHAMVSDAAELLSDVNEDQFHWSPDEKEWSIGACLHHITLVNAHIFPLIDRMIEQGSANMWHGDGILSSGWLGRWLLKRMEPPVERCFKSPASVVPPPQAPLAEVCKHFFDDQETYQEKLSRCEGLDLSKPKARSPFFKLIKLNLGQWIALGAAHERRHLWQARQLLLREDFPQGDEAQA